MVETADFADFTKKSVLICVICGFLVVSFSVSASPFPLRLCVTLGANEGYRKLKTFFLIVNKIDFSGKRD